MNPHNTDTRRRLLLKGGFSCLVATALAARAQAPRVAESDPQAQALGYRLDASRVDRAKQPKYRAGDQCSKCQFFTGKTGDDWGACAIFGGKQVGARGWCSAYAKRG